MYICVWCSPNVILCYQCTSKISAFDGPQCIWLPWTYSDCFYIFIQPPIIKDWKVIRQTNRILNMRIVFHTIKSRTQGHHQSVAVFWDEMLCQGFAAATFSCSLFVVFSAFSFVSNAFNLFALNLSRDYRSVINKHQWSGSAGSHVHARASMFDRWHGLTRFHLSSYFSLS